VLTLKAVGEEKMLLEKYEGYREYSIRTGGSSRDVNAAV
jgi:hypothetical protein